MLNNIDISNLEPLTPDHELIVESDSMVAMPMPDLTNNSIAFASPTDLLSGIISGKVIDKMTETGTSEKIDAHVDKMIDHSIKLEEIKLDNSIEDAKSQKETIMFERNSNAPKLFGMSDKSPEWQQKAMRFWHDLLWSVWFIICLPTVAPIMFISLRLKTIIKNVWIAAILAIFIYSIIVLLPIFMTFLRG